MAEPYRLPELGELESQVMTYLWERGEADVRQAWEAIGAARGLTSNTVQSTLKRLYTKGLADRDKVSHAYVYRPALSRAAYARRCLEELAGALGAEPEPMLMAFVDVAEAAGPTQLGRLEALVASRLAELGEDDKA